MKFLGNEFWVLSKSYIFPSALLKNDIYFPLAYLSENFKSLLS
jgi:hypothetical protein